MNYHQVPMPDNYISSGEGDIAFNLCIKNNVDELARLNSWLQHTAAILDIPDDILFKLDLILTEVVSNIIFYARPESRQSDISISLGKPGDYIETIIEDAGVPFNPLQTPDVPQPDSLADANIGGLGIHLIRHYIDQGDYQRTADRNILTLQLKLAAPEVSG
jgi:serine/threonine-protein kinase RsbW